MSLNPLMPYKLKVLRSEYKGGKINYLDVGCGNHSPKVTKKWFPEWNYFGLDRDDYEIDNDDKSLMEEYYKLDLTQSDCSELPEDYFDIIMLSHVVEHLHNGLQVIETLMSKLKQGGKIYIEFPSARSLGLPNMQGTLNFCDDPTHVRVYSVREVSNLLLSNNFKIVRAGIRRDKMRLLLSPLIFLYKYIRTSQPSAGSLWDLTGFADYVYAEKNENN